jgi:hypothetical protein
MEVYGVDLAEWYAAGRWVALLDYIDGLPGASRLNEAIVNDKETAAEIAAMPRSDEEWAPRVSEFGLAEHMLREVIHELKQLRQATIAVSGNKPPAEKPFPVPRTEVERAIENIERQWAESFVGKFGFDANDI